VLLGTEEMASSLSSPPDNSPCLRLCGRGVTESGAGFLLGKDGADGCGKARLLRALLDIRDFSYVYPSHSSRALNAVSLEVLPGECVCITGPSGSGKTTLVLAIQGLLKRGEVSGKIVFAGTDGKRPVGLVFQDPETQILCSTVEDEVAFGPRNLHLHGSDVRKRVNAALGSVGLSGYEKRSVEEMSAGEKRRLAIASVLSLGPALTLFDEPSAQLDTPGKEKLVEILKTLKDQGHTLIIVDHEITLYGSLADTFYFMDRGSLMEMDRESALAPIKALVNGLCESNLSIKASGSVCVETRGLDIAGGSGAPLLSGIDMEVRQGEFTVIFGRNGSGKTTLLKCMAGLITPDSGFLRVAGISNPRIGDLVGKVGMLLENPSRQLFGESVQEETAFSLKRMQLPPGEVHARVREALDLCGLAHLEDRSPLTLSYGEQHRLAMASVMASRPDILLLDDPFAGLDFPQRGGLLKILEEFCTRHGSSMILTSHDPGSWEGCQVDRKWILEKGKMTCG
jgi:energy-coupling factor transport system ATP-binding protein